MKYFSLFTGIGGFEIAIHKVFPDAECMGFSEIDKFAIQTYLKNYPEHSKLNFGNIEEIDIANIPDFDLLVGGPPCQNLSIAKSNREGLEGSKSRLFYKYLEILKVKKPKYFIMENVASMSVEDKEKITAAIKNVGYNVEPMMIDASLVSAQKRKRLYWFNWKIEQPDDEGVIMENIVAWSRSTRYPKNKKSYVEQRETRNGKANTLTTGFGCGSFSSKNYKEENGAKRQLTSCECEELQCFPLDWTSRVSDSQRYKQIGNAVNTKVIEHILKGVNNGRS